MSSVNSTTPNFVNTEQNSHNNARCSNNNSKQYTTQVQNINNQQSTNICARQIRTIVKKSFTETYNVMLDFNNIEEVKNYIKYHSDLNKLNKYGISFLCIACIRKAPLVVMRLLVEDNITDLNLKDKNGRFPVKIALCHDVPGVVELLINHGADINQLTCDRDIKLFLKWVLNNKERVKQNSNIYNGGLLNLACKVADKDMIKFALSCCNNMAVEVNKTSFAETCNIILDFNNIEEVKDYIECYSDLDKLNKYGVSFLCIACINKAPLVVMRLLLENNITDVNLKNTQNRIPLEIALRNNIPGVVELLINHGADINQLTSDQHIELFLEWARNNKELVKQNSNIYNGGLLDLACKVIDKDMIQFALSCGAEIAVQDNKTSFTETNYVLVHFDNIEEVKAYIKNHSDLDKLNGSGESFLSTAFMMEAPLDVIRLLLENNITNPNLSDKHYGLPLEIALRKNALGVVELLIKHGADIRELSHEGIKLFLTWVIQNEELVKQNSNIYDGGLLHLACKVADKDVINFVLSCGADINKKNYEGKTPSEIAVEHGNDDIAARLFRDVEISKLNSSNLILLLRLQIANGNYQIPISPDIIDSVVKEDAVDILQYFYKNNLLDFQDGYLLNLACKFDYSSIKIIKFLLSIGCDVNQKDKQDRTPLHITFLKINPEILEILLDNGADINELKHAKHIALILDWAIRENYQLILNPVQISSDVIYRLISNDYIDSIKSLLTWADDNDNNLKETIIHNHKELLACGKGSSNISNFVSLLNLEQKKVKIICIANKYSIDYLYANTKLPRHIIKEMVLYINENKDYFAKKFRKILTHIPGIVNIEYPKIGDISVCNTTYFGVSLKALLFINSKQVIGIPLKLGNVGSTAYTPIKAFYFLETTKEATKKNIEKIFLSYVLKIELNNNIAGFCDNYTNFYIHSVDIILNMLIFYDKTDKRYYSIPLNEVLDVATGEFNIIKLKYILGDSLYKKLCEEVITTSDIPRTLDKNAELPECMEEILPYISQRFIYEASSNNKLLSDDDTDNIDINLYFFSAADWNAHVNLKQELSKKAHLGENITLPYFKDLKDKLTKSFNQ